MYIDFAKKKGEGLQDPICVSPIYYRTLSILNLIRVSLLFEYLHTPESIKLAPYPSSTWMPNFTQEK